MKPQALVKRVRKVVRDTTSGRFTFKWRAKAHPKETVTETVEQYRQ